MGEFYFTFCVAENFIIYEVNYFISRSDISLYCNELLDWLEYCVQNEYESQAAKPYVSRVCGFFRFSFQTVRIRQTIRYRSVGRKTVGLLQMLSDSVILTATISVLLGESSMNRARLFSSGALFLFAVYCLIRDPDLPFSLPHFVYIVGTAYFAVFPIKDLFSFSTNNTYKGRQFSKYYEPAENCDKEDFFTSCYAQ